MNLFITGETGTGKSVLKDELIREYGWTFAEPATGDEADLQGTPPEERIPSGTGDGRVFTKADILAADAVVASPDQIRAILSAMPDEWFRLVMVKAEDDEVRKSMVVGSAADPEAALRAFEESCRSDRKIFDAFMDDLMHRRLPDNLGSHAVLTNTYGHKDIEEFAINLELSRRFVRNMEVVVRQLIETNVIRHDDAMRPIVVFDERPEEPVHVGRLIESMETDGPSLGGMMRRWLQLENVDLVPKADANGPTGKSEDD